MFSREILLKNKVPRLLLKKKDTLFREDERAIYLYYLTEGEIRIFNTDSEGKEFLIEKVSNYKFLGEPPFLLGERYPANSTIISDTAEIFRFTKEHFNQFMMENPDLLFQFTTEIARKAYNKTMTLKSIVHQNPNERILNFLKTYKRNQNIDLSKKIIIEVTRKEMANSTGLAIETVIRTVKKMEREKKIELINHKILF